MMLIGTTFAWFTDSVVSSSNKIKAGKLDIVLQQLGDDGQYASVEDEPIFESSLWEPGYSECAVLRIANAGSLALKWRLDIVSNGDAGKLGDVIDVYAKISEGAAITAKPESFAAAKEDGYVKVGTLNELMADADGAAYGVLYSASDTSKPADGYSEVYAGLILHMNENAGNEYRDLSVGTSFDIVLNATQFTHESDSFDNLYDQNVDILFENLKNQMSSGGDVTMVADVVLPLQSQTTDGSIDPIMTVTNDTTLNMAGQTLSLDQQEVQQSLPYVPVVVAVEDGTLTLDGEGVINAEAGNNTSYGINVNGGTLVINNGSYYGAMSAVQVQKGKLVINGGFFDLAPTIKQAAPQYATYLINCIDSAYKDGTAAVEICGGTFVNFDPSNNGAEGAGTNFVPEGYTVRSEVKDNGETWYTVYKAAGTAADLESAVENAKDGETIYIGQNLSPDSTLELENSIVLDLGNNVIGGDNNSSAGIRLSGDGKDITIKADQGGVQLDNQRCFYVSSKNSDILFDGGNYSVEGSQNDFLMEDTSFGGGNTVTIQNITYTGGRGVQFSSSQDNNILIKDSIFNTDGYATIFIGGINNVCTLENVTINGGGNWGSRLFASNSGHKGDDGYSIIYVKSGFYDCKLATSDGCIISISGGTFADNPTEYLADGYKADYDSASQMWTVTAK